MKILYVEDNEVDADLTRRALAEYAADLDLDIANTLGDARDRLSQGGGYDLVLSDLNLPDGNGMELVAEIREQGLPVAVVVLTSAGDEATVVAALKSGADDYLAKRDGYLLHLYPTLESSLARFRTQAARRSRRLHILYAEHNAADFDLAQRHLARYAAHISLEAVQTAPEILQRLRSPGDDTPRIDVILLDYRLQGLNALEIMKTLRDDLNLDIPIVLITGQGDEETAAQALHLGASDYLSKREGYLFELPTALENAFNRAQLTREHAALQASEARFRLLAENAQDIIYRYRIAPVPGFEYISPAVTAITGYTPQEFYADPQMSTRLLHSDDTDQIAVSQTGHQRGSAMAMRWRAKDGRTIWLEVTNSVVLDETGKVMSVEGIARDITERKRLEEAEHDERVLAEALLDTIAAINSTLDLNEVLSRILSNVGLVIPHDGANIMLVDQQNQMARVVGVCDCYARNQLPAPVLDKEFSFANLPILRQMIDDKRAWVLADVRASNAWFDRDASTEWIRSYAGAPISIGGELIGLLNLDSRITNAFSEENTRRLQAFADQAAVAVRNAQLFHRLQEHSQNLQEAVERRTAELSQIKERVEAIINNSPDAILMLDPNGLINTGNPAFSQWFGFTGDELYDHPLVELADPESSQDLEQALTRVVEQLDTQRLDFKAIRKDGMPFDVMVALAPIQEDGHLLGVVCSLQDISKLKEVERMKDEFVSNVSHELRTPITSIRLNQKLIRLNPEREHAYLERMEREVERLNTLIEDLLRLSRLDQRRTDMDLEPVNLNNLVDEHVEDRSPIAESWSLTLSAQKDDDLPEVEADRGLLGQALSVLLTNALHYTPAGGAITVSTSKRIEDGEGWVGIRVSDTGPGIPVAEHQHLFERFFRGKIGRASGKPGTGLGLAIAQEIVSLHQGMIEVGSNDTAGHGATFSVWLPMKPEPEMQERG